MAFCRALFFFIVFISAAASAQDNRYMVFFKDKALSPYSTSNPGEFLSERAIERRSKQQIAVIEQDIPVIEDYVQGVRDIGAVILFKTRWMNGVLVQCDPSMLSTIEALPFVNSTELVAPGAKPSTGGRRRINARLNNGTEVTTQQNRMLGIDDMHKSGYHGEGMLIAVLDAGFEGVNATQPFQHLFDENRIQLTYDFAYRQTDVYAHDDHGTQVFSTIAAYSPGTFVGGTYKSTFQLYVTEHVPTEYRVEEYNWLFAAERADSSGVDIISSSLGYNTFDDASMSYSKAELDGKTTVITRAAQWSFDRGIIVVVSAGNEGANSWKIITAPADGKDVIAVGNVNSVGERSNSSSIGPTADGNIKPDVAATGVSTAVIKPNGNTGVASGTSLAAPQITSLIAGVWQTYPHLTNQEVIEFLRSSSSQSEDPDNLLGYGIPNYVAIVNKIEWEPQEKLVVVYPNPVVDTITIKPQNPIDISTARVEVLTMQGQIIATQTLSFNWLNRTYVADCSELSAGLYILRVWIGAMPFAFKLVKI